MYNKPLAVKDVQLHPGDKAFLLTDSFLLEPIPKFLQITRINAFCLNIMLNTLG
jgi:hypothetical protein